MIFVTVGTQLPFDRLVRAMDRWAADHPGQEVIVQSAEGDYQPQHMHCEPYMAPDRYAEVLARCAHMVAHAGIGSILTARRSGIPILIVPRLEELMEVRSDHQVATANALRGRPGIVVCDDLASFDECMDQLLAMKRGPATMNAADPSLVTALQRFVDLGEFPD